jgi:hypothetical protein
MQTKNFKFNILQRMHRKFPAIQQNHQNSILFHEPIPLSGLHLFQLPEALMSWQV